MELGINIHVNFYESSLCFHLTEPDLLIQSFKGPKSRILVLHCLVNIHVSVWLWLTRSCYTISHHRTTRNYYLHKTTIVHSSQKCIQKCLVIMTVQDIVVGLANEL